MLRFNSYVESGSSQVFWAGTGGRQPVYTLFSANYDAQCIAFATASWPEFSNNFGWVGDWGSECAVSTILLLLRLLIFYVSSRIQYSRLHNR